VDWEATVREAAAKALDGGEAVVPSDVANRENVERVVREWLEGWGWNTDSIEFTESEAGVRLTKAD
jgi:hypothetical protein